MYPSSKSFYVQTATHPRVFRGFDDLCLSSILCTSCSCVYVLVLYIPSRYRLIKRRSVNKDPLNAFHRMTDALGGTFYVFRIHI